MWTREQLKDKAKAFLSVNYWQAFLVSLVIGFFSGHGGGNFNWRNNDTFKDPTALMLFLLFIAGVFIVFMAVRIFIGYALEVGGRRFFVQAANDQVNLNNLGYGFSNNYSNVIRTMFWRDLLNFCFYLLLIIPGIIKSYAYRMVPYILADNPRIDSSRAIELSERMTDGHKLNIFVLDLSFIGWYLLGIMACCIGIVFVMPYVDATDAQLYLVLRQNALDNRACTYEDLQLTRAFSDTQPF